MAGRRPAIMPKWAPTVVSYLPELAQAASNLSKRVNGGRRLGVAL